MGWAAVDEPIATFGANPRRTAGSKIEDNNFRRRSWEIGEFYEKNEPGSEANACTTPSSPLASAQFVWL